MATQTETRRKVQIKKPARYCNIFLNNDKTPFESVIHILTTVFNYEKKKAMEKAQEIHTGGKGIVFVSSNEVCSFKKDLVDKEKANIGETNLEHLVKLLDDSI